MYHGFQFWDVKSFFNTALKISDKVIVIQAQLKRSRLAVFTATFTLLQGLIILNNYNFLFYLTISVTRCEQDRTCAFWNRRGAGWTKGLKRYFRAENGIWYLNWSQKFQSKAWCVGTTARKLLSALVY